MTREVIVLGSTGSIGVQALDVIAALPNELHLQALAAGRDIDTLEAQADRHGVVRVAVADQAAAAQLSARRPDLDVLVGPSGVAELAGSPADIVLNGIAGAAGLASTLAALERKTPVALANKESLIVGGPLVTVAADAAGGRDSHLLPVDSEHSALAQCLRGGQRDELERLVLTASGGPFRGWSASRLASVSPADALISVTCDPNCASCADSFRSSSSEGD